MIQIQQRLIPPALVETTLRRIYLEIECHGIHPGEFATWKADKRWFPWLESSAEIEELRIAAGVHNDCDRQIVLHFPDTDTRQERPHQDRPRPGSILEQITGVALTESNWRNGGIRIWYDTETPAERWEAMDLLSGDIIIMPGDTWHSGGPNLTGAIRKMVYFRTYTSSSGSGE